MGPMRQFHIDPAIDERGAYDNGDESPQQNRLSRIAKEGALRPVLWASHDNETEAARENAQALESATGMNLPP